MGREHGGDGGGGSVGGGGVVVVCPLPLLCVGVGGDGARSVSRFSKCSVLLIFSLSCFFETVPFLTKNG